MSKTTFKDVAHLYIGCKVETVHYTNNNNNLSMPIIDDFDGYHYDCLIENCDFHYIKPILRKLSNMTKEEDYEASEIWHSAMADRDSSACGHAAMTYYLLSKSFDLFGLIESSQAIDASTLK